MSSNCRLEYSKRISLFYMTMRFYKMLLLNRKHYKYVFVELLITLIPLIVGVISKSELSQSNVECDAMYVIYNK